MASLMYVGSTHRQSFGFGPLHSANHHHPTSSYTHQNAGSSTIAQLRLHAAKAHCDDQQQTATVNPCRAYTPPANYAAHRASAPSSMEAQSAAPTPRPVKGGLLCQPETRACHRCRRTPSVISPPWEPPDLPAKRPASTTPNVDLQPVTGKETDHRIDLAGAPRDLRQPSRGRNAPPPTSSHPLAFGCVIRRCSGFGKASERGEREVAAVRVGAAGERIQGNNFPPVKSSKIITRFPIPSIDVPNWLYWSDRFSPNHHHVGRILMVSTKITFRTQ